MFRERMMWCCILIPAVTLVSLCLLADDKDAGSEEKVLVVSKVEDVAARLRPRVKKLLEKCPEDYKLRITLGQFFDFGHSSSSNQLEDYVQSAVPVDPEGKPDGVEQFFSPRSPWPHRAVPYKNGAKHGVEKIHEGKHLKVEIPWENDAINGVRKTFRPKSWRPLSAITEFHSSCSKRASRPRRRRIRPRRSRRSCSSRASPRWLR